MNIIQNFFVKQREKKLRRQLKNKDFTIIASECAAGVIYHNLGLRFDSPTINLWLLPKDFLEFVKYLSDYVDNAELLEDTSINCTYPVGILKLEEHKSLHVFFQHYDTFLEAKEKWEKRKRRIHYNNIYIIMTDRDGVTLSDIKAFSALPFKHKVMLTGINYPFNSTFYIKNCMQDKHLGDIFKQNRITGKRKLDTFDYISFLNDKS